ncbi:DUF4062 domain-containing protein [Deinococcus soli (ex Cha et al. 2016)]|uniref:DUF4062 domain-containing protein n=1 Tax=Deinococcus soli (ex Cha et al. 2016) TaxID=1309411 RepID=UPI0009D6F6F5|nr:DUF4062 domain-containing protein [Deinococcus soli (ex Cha et al. 2016)]
MDKRYTVFVSSTYTDMIDERNAVIQAIMRAGHIPLGMEAFGAANASSWKVITKTIDAADYYVLLIARRYGSINEAVNLGYTEQEFRYAVEKEVPVLVFLLEENASWPGNYTDTEADAVMRLRSFRASASKDRQVAFWKSKADLPYVVMTALTNTFSDDPRPGWIRPFPINSVGVMEELARLSEENSRLKDIIGQKPTVYGGEEVDQILHILENEKLDKMYFNVTSLSGPVSIKFKPIAMFIRVASHLEHGKFLADGLYESIADSILNEMEILSFVDRLKENREALVKYTEHMIRLFSRMEIIKYQIEQYEEWDYEAKPFISLSNLGPQHLTLHEKWRPERSAT